MKDRNTFPGTAWRRGLGLLIELGGLAILLGHLV